MVKVGIDARLFGQTGVGVYIRNLLYQLEKRNDKDATFFIYLSKDDINKVAFRSERFIKREAFYRWHSFSEQTGFLKTLNKDDLDLMHFTYFSFPVLYRRRFIVTVHDLTPYFFKTGKASSKGKVIYELKYRAFRFSLSQQIRNALSIITPSRTVGEQVVNVFGENARKKIKVLYEGINQELINAKEKKSLKDTFQVNFFLYVGNFYPHKNVERLIYAFSKLSSDVRLVLAGPKDYFSNRVAQLIHSLDLAKRIAFHLNPGLEDLVFFYKNAVALINPSLSEGFGLPLVEAGYFKLPIIASDIPVFREVCGGDCIYFDPKSTDDITGKLRGILQTKKRFLLKNVEKKFSFERMADETLKIYKKVLRLGSK